MEVEWRWEEERTQGLDTVNAIQIDDDQREDLFYFHNDNY